MAHRLRVQVVEGPQTGKTFEIESPHAVVGTSPACDIVVRDPEVSRRHCVIEVRDGAYRIRDLDSTNGTFVEDVRVTDAEIPTGGRLRIGSSAAGLQAEEEVRALETFGRAPHSGDWSAPPLPCVSSSDCFIASHRLHWSASCEARRVQARKSRRARCTNSAPGPPRRSLSWIARQSPRASPSPSCSAMRRAPSPARTERAPAHSKPPTGAPCFSTRSAIFPSRFSPSCCGCSNAVKRLGASRFVDVDVRVIAATRRHSHHGAHGHVSGGPVLPSRRGCRRIPRLRDRRDDVEMLAERLLLDEVDTEPRRGTSRRGPCTCSAARLARKRPRIAEHHSPRCGPHGFRHHPRLRPPRRARFSAIRHHPQDCTPVVDRSVRRPRWDAPQSRARAVESRLERAYVLRLLERCNGDVAQAAAKADVHPKSFQRLMRQLGINHA